MASDGRSGLSRWALVFLLACPLSAQAEELSAKVSLGWFRWLEDGGDFVRETGYLPRLELALADRLAPDWRWETAIEGGGGQVDYHGVVQNTGAHLSSHTRYRSGSARADIGKALSPDIDVRAELGAGQWLRSIHNPLDGGDQPENFRLGWAGLYLDLQSGEWLRLAFGARFPFWVREDAHLDRFRLDNALLAPRGRWSPQIQAAWTYSRHVQFGLAWETLKLASSPPLVLGNATVFQPPSTLDYVSGFGRFSW